MFLSVIIVLFFVLAPLSVAYFIGRHRKIGFWLSLVVSVVTTPFIGFLITSGSRLKNAPGCNWCGNAENEAEYCGLCGKNINGDIKPGFVKR